MYAIQTILAKANENLDAAKICLKASFNNACSSRAYFACAQAAAASLLRSDQFPNPPNHERIYRKFLGSFGKSHPFLPRTLLILRSLRETADYKDTNINRKQAIDCIGKANDFVNQIHQILGRK